MDRSQKPDQTKKGWYCTGCDNKIPDEVALGSMSTIDPKYRNGRCYKCKKSRVFRHYE